MGGVGGGGVLWKLENVISLLGITRGSRILVFARRSEAKHECQDLIPFPNEYHVHSGVDPHLIGPRARLGAHATVLLKHVNHFIYGGTVL